MLCVKVWPSNDKLANAQLTSSTAGNTLYQAECGAYELQKRAAKDPNAYHSPIYPPGTEYAVCQAEAQLMSAVVGLLNESLTEAIKSFYKLRKAYLALEGVMENERNYLERRSTSSVNPTGSSKPLKGGLSGSRSGSVRSKVTPGGLKSTNTSAGASTTSLKQSTTLTKPAVPTEPPAIKKPSDKDDDDDDFDFVDAEEEHKGNEMPVEYMGHLNMPAGQDGSIALDNAQRKLDLESSSASRLPSASNNPSTSVPDAIDEFEQLTLNELGGGPETDISEFSDHPVDSFIFAGANFCFGMLLLLLSFIPPSFATLLKVVGFKGDRERGMNMLWRATKFHDIHGAMSGIVLMGFLNGFTSICDIVSSAHVRLTHQTNTDSF